MHADRWILHSSNANESSRIIQQIENKLFALIMKDLTAISDETSSISCTEFKLKIMDTFIFRVFFILFINELCGILVMPTNSSIRARSESCIFGTSNKAENLQEYLPFPLILSCLTYAIARWTRGSSVHVSVFPMILVHCKNIWCVFRHRFSGKTCNVIENVMMREKYMIHIINYW